MTAKSVFNRKIAEAEIKAKIYEERVRGFKIFLSYTTGYIYQSKEALFHFEEIAFV